MTLRQRIETAKTTTDSLRRRSWITPFGTAVAAVGAVSWLIAWRLGWREAAIVAAGCLLLVIAGMPFLFRRGTFSATIDVADRRFTRGDRDATGTFTVRNEGSFRSLPQRVELSLGQRPTPYEVQSLAAGAQAVERFKVPTEQRAVVQIGPVTMVRGDPLGLYRRDATYAESVTVHVHPRHVRIPPVSSGWVRDIDGPTFDDSPRGDIAFHTIREYVPGDDFRHVHWKSTARAGTMMVRQYVDNRRPDLLLIVDQNESAYGHPEEFERVLEIVASIELACSRAAHGVVHHRGTVRAGGRGPTAMLDDLSAAALHPGDDLLRTTKRAIASDSNSTVGVVLTGSKVEPAVLRRATQNIERVMRSISIRVVPGHAQLRESTHGVSIAVDSMDDFARSWRAVCS